VLLDSNVALSALLVPFPTQLHRQLASAVLLGASDRRQANRLASNVQKVHTMASQVKLGAHFALLDPTQLQLDRILVLSVQTELPLLSLAVNLAHHVQLGLMQVHQVPFNVFHVLQARMPPPTDNQSVSNV